MEHIEINGLLWDTENLEIDGKKYFTWQEAINAAKSVGKRLPSKKELEELIATGWEWDEGNKGMWIADKRLFFPACGYKDYSTDRIYAQGHNVRVWSSSLISDSHSFYLAGYMGDSSVNSHCNGFYELAMRCVQDIKSDNSEPMPSKNIDWEQRKFDVAKELYCYTGFDEIDSIRLANSFIQKYKEDEKV